MASLSEVVLTSDLNLPTAFGSFYLYDLIGRGGMAEIFLAKTFTSLGAERQCVIKRILPDLSSDQKFGDMLIDEAKLCARLSHANVVQTFDLGLIDQQYFIAMEYVEGFDLNRLLGLLSKAGLALPLDFALYIITEALRGLDYAHRLDDHDGSSLAIIHRDVSPTNVLISVDGEVKLCDFGIAKAALANLSTSSVDDDMIKGKVAYMSPEHVGGKDIDSRADLFAAGILLWELLAGRRLYKTRNQEETYHRAKLAEIPPLDNKGFPKFDELQALVSKALTKDPTARFQSGKEFIEAIDNYMHSASMMVSQLKFAEFLTENFGEDLMQQRRARERQMLSAMDRMNPPPINGGQIAAQVEPRLDGEVDEAANAIRASFDLDSEPPSGVLPPPHVSSGPVTEQLPVRDSLTPSLRLGQQPAGQKRKVGLIILAVGLPIALLAGLAAAWYFGGDLLGLKF